ncbi:VOC family protein, partial [Psychrobacter sp.]|uniref:VOC family protein n=1 Tax=Psychrobacter sp. TaxID=56811 RepID=UPI0028AE9664
MSFKIEQIHHVAYRCKDAKETVEWYKKHLNMDFILAFAEDHVPSTKAFDPYMHVFLDAGNGNVLAFFEVPNQPEMGFDPNTPNWVQHLAMKVKDRDTLMAAKKHLEEGGIDVIGVTNHGIFHSIYFFDPNGHRLELTYDDPTSEDKVSMITEAIKQDMLDEWSRTKRAPVHTQFLHSEELA